MYPTVEHEYPQRYPRIFQTSMNNRNASRPYFLCNPLIYNGPIVHQALLSATEIQQNRQTLNRKFITSPSCTMYSLPSARILPASLAPCSPLVGDVVFIGDGLCADEAAFEVGVDHARGLGAVAPIGTVQARTSFTPAVK